MKMFKAVKKLKFWSRKKKKRKSLGPEPCDPASHCHCYYSCSSVQPSAPPLPSWLQAELTQDAIPTPNQAEHFPEFSYPTDYQVQYPTQDIVSSPMLPAPVPAPSYQQYMVPNPVYGLPVVQTARRERSAGKGWDGNKAVSEGRKIEVFDDSDSRSISLSNNNRGVSQEVAVAVRRQLSLDPFLERDKDTLCVGDIPGKCINLVAQIRDPGDTSLNLSGNQIGTQPLHVNGVSMQNDKVLNKALAHVDKSSISLVEPMSLVEVPVHKANVLNPVSTATRG
ncbi:hypothetical protein REPUB_Repub13aG0012600 [Reevesia pubescens]